MPPSLFAGCSVILLFPLSYDSLRGVLHAAPPFLYMCLFLRDRVVGAFCCAGTAVYALIGVDDVLVFALADAADGTCVSASAALYTVVIDYVCHLKHLHFQR